MCFVIAKRFTRLNPDQALLTGLLHVLGRLYIIMRSKDAAELSDTEMGDVIDGWHASIGKAILESWGLPEDAAARGRASGRIENDFRRRRVDRPTCWSRRSCSRRARPIGAVSGVAAHGRDRGRRQQRDGAVRRGAEERSGVVGRTASTLRRLTRGRSPYPPAPPRGTAVR